MHVINKNINQSETADVFFSRCSDDVMEVRGGKNDVNEEGREGESESEIGKGNNRIIFFNNLRFLLSFLLFIYLFIFLPSFLPSFLLVSSRKSFNSNFMNF